MVRRKKVYNQIVHLFCFGESPKDRKSGSQVKSVKSESLDSIGPEETTNYVRQLVDNFSYYFLVIIRFKALSARYLLSAIYNWSAPPNP